MKDSIEEKVNLLSGSFIVNTQFVARETSDYAPIQIKDNCVKLQFDSYLIIPREKVTKSFLNEIGYSV